MSFFRKASPSPGRFWRANGMALLLLGIPSGAFAQQPTPYENLNALVAKSPVTVTKVRGGVSLLTGAGGNIGVLAGNEGIFMIDTGIDVSKDKILSALEGLSSGKLRYAANTHWHWDHADGNSWVRELGATVIATPNTARRLGQTIRVAEWGHTFTPNPPAHLPNMLLTRAKTINFSGEEVLLTPYEDGHTDGDLSAYFRRADVLVVGDTFWNGQYPFVDYVAGGSIDGAIRLANANVSMAGAGTLVIPGHGPVGSKADLIAFRDMLVDVRRRVASLKAKGLSLEEVLLARPTSHLDAKWGTGLISGEQFTTLVYRGV